MAMWGAMFGGMGGGDRDRDGNIFGMLAMMILAPIAALMLQMALSRSREYEADHSGAELLGTGEPLARALEKIESVTGPTLAIKRGSAHLCITDPLGRRMNIREGHWADLFASHPPMAARIAALKGMAYEN